MSVTISTPPGSPSPIAAGQAVPIEVAVTAPDTVADLVIQVSFDGSTDTYTGVRRVVSTAPASFRAADGAGNAGVDVVSVTATDPVHGGSDSTTMLEVMGMPRIAASVAAGQRYNAVDAYQALSEVHYRLDAESGTLWRIEQPFERLDTRRDRSLFNPRNREPGSRAFTDLGVPVDNGILHLEIRFWSQLTRQWETAKTDRDGGPALEWDSSRRELNDFFLGMRVRNPADPPQFVMPRLARVILVFEPVTGEARGVPLAADLGPTDREMKVEDSRPIPDPPGYLRVGGEWIEYDRKEAHAIGIKRRGLDAVRRRGEKPVHPAGTTVHYGETFVADVVIPTTRDAKP